MPVPVEKSPSRKTHQGRTARLVHAICVWPPGGSFEQANRATEKAKTHFEPSKTTALTGNYI